MFRQRLNQRGFSAIEGLLLIIAVVLITFTGYYIYHAQKNTSATLNSASQVAKSSPKTSSPTAAAVNPVVFHDSTGTAYEIALLAKTADQKGIAAALNKQCQANAQTNGAGADNVVAVTGTKELFTGTDPANNFVMNGNFSKVNTGCYDITKGGAQWDSGAANYYLEKQAGQWTFVTASQMQPDCKDWDGTGVPSNIVSTCYDDTTTASRAPTPKS
jgi:hypothetical protein